MSRAVHRWQGFAWGRIAWVVWAACAAWPAPAHGQQATFDFGGGFKWGTKASESCQINLSLLLHTDGTALMTGTVCGYSVSVSVD